MDTLWPVIMETLYYHHLYALPPTTVLRHTLQHILNFNHTPPTYVNFSFQNSIMTNDVPTSVWYYTHIKSLSHISWTPNYFNLLISHLTLRANIVFLTAHAIVHTNTFTCLFTFYLKKGLKQISASTLTYVLRYNPFIINSLQYMEKMSHYHIKKTAFPKFLLIRLITFITLFLHIHWQVATRVVIRDGSCNTSLCMYLGTV